MCLVKVLGVGSPHGADQLAWKVVEQLRQQTTLKPYLGNALDCVILNRPGPSLIDYLQSAPTVVIIDAALDGGPTGRVRQYSATELLESQIQFSSHQFGVQQSLALAQALSDLPEGLRVIAISVSDEYQAMTEPDCEQWAVRLAPLIAARLDSIVSAVS